MTAGNLTRRGSHFTPEFQRAARAKVKRESLQRAGAAGWASCAARYGNAWAGQVAAAWRRDHPSSLERQVSDWLHEFCVAFEREVAVDGVYADFVVADFGLVVEVDGARWHGQERQAQDAFKDDVFAKHGYHVLRLLEADIKSGAAHAQLDQALHGTEAPWLNS